VEPGERLTTDPDEIDLRAVWRWLHDESYWARGRPWPVQQQAMAASRCFAIVGPGGDTRAFCRLVTDGATFAWLADVFVRPEFRGRGLGKEIVAEVARFQDDAGVRRILLSTDGAHGLYGQYGFASSSAPFMDRIVEYPTT
jgi:GNAT superfamily N-acetyltransferase